MTADVVQRVEADVVIVNSPPRAVEPAVDEVQDNETLLTNPTPTETVDLPPVVTPPNASSPSRMPKRLPIWARGTMAQPVRLGRSQVQMDGSTAQSQSPTPLDSTPGIHNRSRSLSSSLARISLQDPGRPPLSSTNSRSPAFGTSLELTGNPRHRRQAGSEGQLQPTHSIQSMRRGQVSVTSAALRSNMSSLPASHSVARSNSSSRQILSLPESSASPRNAFQGRILTRRSQVSSTATRDLETYRDRSTTFSRNPQLRTAASQPQLRRLSNKKRETSLPTSNRPSSARHDKSAGEEEGECCVCMNAPSDCVFYRCGHICACLECAKKFKHCPICRESVSDIIKIWKS